MALLLSVARVGSAANEAASDSLRVALLTSGPISDQAWSGEANRGLLTILQIEMLAAEQWQEPFTR